MPAATTTSPSPSRSTCCWRALRALLGGADRRTIRRPSFRGLVARPPHSRTAPRRQEVAPLTRTEYLILETLMRRAGCIVPRDALVEAGWGGGADVAMERCTSSLRSLRLKIAQAGELQLLHTARGIATLCGPRPLEAAGFRFPSNWTAWFSAVFLVGFNHVRRGDVARFGLLHVARPQPNAGAPRLAPVELMRSSVNANDGQRAYRFPNSPTLLRKVI